MPELPEVENVRRGLEANFKDKPSLVAFRFSRFSLRKPVPAAALKKLNGVKFENVFRWGKYLFFETSQGLLLNHLGMTGKWKKESGSLTHLKMEKHDHLALEFSNGIILVYNDPRRFGWVEFLKPLGEKLKELESQALALGLGVDPTVSSPTGEWLRQKLRSRKTPIKSALLDQSVIAGLGNIYVSEILFRSGIRPNRSSQKISLSECDIILKNTHQVLAAAISAGGSTIRDYRNASGEEGGFQKQHQVYDREGESCVVCATPIRATVIAGRSTFWCARCQK